MTDTARTELADGIARIRLDDGKASVLGSPVIAAVHAGRDRAEKDAKALVLTGRSGRFRAGFDVAELGGGGAQARALAGLDVRAYRGTKASVQAELARGIRDRLEAGPARLLPGS